MSQIHLTQSSCLEVQTVEALLALQKVCCALLAAQSADMVVGSFQTRKGYVSLTEVAPPRPRGGDKKAS